MNRICFIVVLWMAGLRLQAQVDMAYCWKSMPDSIFPFLNENMRGEMVDFYQMNVVAETNNLLKEKSVMNKLTGRFADISLSNSSTLQLGLLSTNQGDSLICMVHTWDGGDASESQVSFFDLQWNRCSRLFMVDTEKMSLTHRPDTMSVETYGELCQLMEPQMQKVTMDPEDLSLTFTLTVPLLTTKEREQIQSVVLQKKLKWDGEIYK